MCRWCVEVVTVQVQYVRPSPCDDVATASESVLTEECRIQTNLSDDAIRNAQPLELVVDEVCSVNRPMLHLNWRNLYLILSIHCALYCIGV